MENLHSYSLHSAIGHLFIHYGGALVRSGDLRASPYPRRKEFQLQISNTVWDSVIYGRIASLLKKL